jgi:hypothetical protein
MTVPRKKNKKNRGREADNACGASQVADIAARRRWQNTETMSILRLKTFKHARDCVLTLRAELPEQLHHAVHSAANKCAEIECKSQSVLQGVGHDVDS